MTVDDNEAWASESSGAEFTFTEQLNRDFLCTRTKDGKQCRVRLSHGVWQSASAEGERNAETSVYEWNWIASPVAGASESREGAAYAYFYYAHTPGGEFHEQQETQE